jgi:hypothetical protein
MNFAPLDSSRQGAYFEIKNFEKFAKKRKFLFSKIFGWMNEFYTVGFLSSKSFFSNKNFCEIRKKIFFLIFEDFSLKRSCLTRGIQRCQIHRRKLLNNGVMAVWNFKILNGHSTVIKQPTAMNFTPLDSSRQRATFETKIFAKFAEIFF